MCPGFDTQATNLDRKTLGGYFAQMGSRAPAAHRKPAIFWQGLGKNCNPTLTRLGEASGMLNGSLVGAIEAVALALSYRSVSTRMGAHSTSKVGIK